MLNDRLERDLKNYYGQLFFTKHAVSSEKKVVHTSKEQNSAIELTQLHQPTETTNTNNTDIQSTQEATTLKL